MGKSNDHIPPRELELAECIADTCRLWEPGRGRTWEVDRLVNIALWWDDCDRTVGEG